MVDGQYITNLFIAPEVCHDKTSYFERYKEKLDNSVAFQVFSIAIILLPISFAFMPLPLHICNHDFTSVYDIRIYAKISLFVCLVLNDASTLVGH